MSCRSNRTADGPASRVPADELFSFASGEDFARWEPFYARTTSGARKRIVVYGKTLDEARAKLGKAQQEARAGIPVPDKAWGSGHISTTGWRNFVKLNRRPATYALYETNIRLYLKPGLGGRKLGHR